MKATFGLFSTSINRLQSSVTVLCSTEALLLLYCAVQRPYCYCTVQYRGPTVTVLCSTEALLLLYCAVQRPYCYCTVQYRGPTATVLCSTEALLLLYCAVQRPYCYCGVQYRGPTVLYCAVQRPYCYCGVQYRGPTATVLCSTEALLLLWCAVGWNKSFTRKCRPLNLRFQTIQRLDSCYI